MKCTNWAGESRNMCTGWFLPALVLLLLSGSALSAPTYTPIGIEQHFNVSRTQGWFSRPGVSYTMANFPGGSQTLSEVTWELGSSGKSLVMLKGSGSATSKAAVTGIPVGKTAEALHVLHTYNPGPLMVSYLAAVEDSLNNRAYKGRMPPPPPTLFRYLLHYADGDTVSLNVRWRETIGDWIRDGDTPDLPFATIAWRRTAEKGWVHDGMHPKLGRHLVVYAARFDNPKPQKTIQTIDIISNNTAGRDFGSAAIFALTVSSGSGRKAPCYVAPAPRGDDSNPGTYDKPWQSLHKGFGSVAANQTLYILGGTYRPTTDVGLLTNGGPGAWIEIAGYPGETHTIVGVDNLWDRTKNHPQDGAIVKVYGRRYTRIKNLRIRDSRKVGLQVDHGTYIEVLYNTVYNTFNAGLRLGNSIRSKAVGNRIIRPNYKTMGSDENDNLVYVHKPPREGLDAGDLKDFEIAHNEICWGQKEAFLLDGANQSGKIHHNHIHHHMKKPWIGGMGPNGYGRVYDLEIYSNIVHDAGSGINVGTEGGGYTSDISIHHNLTYNLLWHGIGVSVWNKMNSSPEPRIRNVDVFNNTIFNCGFGASPGDAAGGLVVGESGGIITNIRVFNNLIAQSGDFNIGLNNDVQMKRDTIIVEYNMVDKHVDNTEGTSSVSIRGENLLTGDPQFVDTDKHDFRVMPGSPCYDAGIPETRYNDPDGSRSDIGAFASALAVVSSTTGPPPLPRPDPHNPDVYQDAGRTALRMDSPGCRIRIHDIRGRCTGRTGAVSRKSALPVTASGMHIVVIEGRTAGTSVAPYVEVR